MGKNTLLQYGTYNNLDVEKLQKALNKAGYRGKDGKKLTVDGDFGANTQYAVKQYQRDHGLAVDGIVGKNTWSSLGLKFNSDYERGSYTGSTGAYGRGAYIDVNKPNITQSGIKLADVEAGVAEIGGDYTYSNWNLEALTIESKAEISNKYIGVNAQASVIEGGAIAKIPLPFTDSKLSLGANINLVSIGAQAGIDIDEKTINFGISLGVGASVSIGLTN